MQRVSTLLEVEAGRLARVAGFARAAPEDLRSTLVEKFVSFKIDSVPDQVSMVEAGYVMCPFREYHRYKYTINMRDQPENNRKHEGNTGMIKTDQ
jgi:hypothetical protein